MYFHNYSLSQLSNVRPKLSLGTSQLYTKKDTLFLITFKYLAITIEEFICFSTTLFKSESNIIFLQNLRDCLYYERVQWYMIKVNGITKSKMLLSLTSFSRYSIRLIGTICSTNVHKSSPICALLQRLCGCSETAIMLLVWHKPQFPL